MPDDPNDPIIIITTLAASPKFSEKEKMTLNELKACYRLCGKLAWSERRFLARMVKRLFA